MIRRVFLSFCLFLSLFFYVYAQGSESGQHSLVIRGEISIDLEPIYAGHVDEEYPLSITTAGHRALEEAAMFFSAMIYGWSFSYEVGERARRIDENLELKPEGIIKFGDPALMVTDTEIRDMQLKIWADYNMDEAAQKRIQTWRTGMIRNAQAIGYAPTSFEEYPGWIAAKQLALEDSARAALRSALRASERNRPKHVTGFISLASFPRYYIDAGRWAVFARFRMQITEIIPFAAY
jgi:hypothetical protein